MAWNVVEPHHGMNGRCSPRSSLALVARYGDRFSLALLSGERGYTITLATTSCAKDGGGVELIIDDSAHRHIP